MQQAETVKAKYGYLLRVGVLAAIIALVSFTMMFGMASAWADEEGDAEFSDTVSDISDQATDEGQQDAAEADAQDDAATLPIAFFDKEKMTVELGKAYLVGFAPEAADAESDDEARAEWHKSWKSAVDEAGVDLSDESGWLAGEDADGNAIDYDAITGIIVEDKEVFELLGEFPEWKVDDEGVEYRWWYGLLGVAKKAGDTKLQIICRDAEGVNQVLDECTVHVVESAGAEDEPSAAALASQADDSAADAETSAESHDESSSEDASDMKSQSSTSVDISTTASDGTSSSSSSDSSDSASASGASASTTASDSTSDSSASTSTTATYPKDMFSTLQGSTISAVLQANDAASEEALTKLANGTTLHLAVEAKTALGTEAEKSLTTLASNNGISVAERLSVKALDANNSEATISGMNLTVKIAADNAMKALDASSVQVWYVGDDGTTEKLNAKLSGGYLTFVTTHLSDFAVMGKASSSSSSSTSSTGKSGLPQTGDTMAYIAIALAFIAGFSAASALNARRRMKE